MQNLITTPADYWIAPNAVSITLNALGNANRIQCGVASGAVIMCFIDTIKAESEGGESGNGDGLWYGANHEPRRWPITIVPTYFNSDTRKYVYAAIPRTTQVGTQALIVFPSELLDIYGRQAAVSDVSPSESSSSSSDDTPAQIGSTDFFYVYLGGIISAVETVNSKEQRRWETRITDWGTLETPQGRDESFSKYTFWGQSVNANNQVTGPLAGSINYIEFANGVRLGVDTADNTLKVYMQNNQQAHLFSTGAVSAFGPSALGGGGGDLILGPLLSALNDEPMPTDDGYLHWTGSAFEWVEPGGGGEMPSTVAWNNITGKPATFQPSAHTHLKEDITDFDHNHDDRYYTESEIDGFLAAKLGKPSQGSYTKLTVASGGGVTWGTLSAADIPSLTKSKISDFPTTWAWSAITGKPTTLADYGITDAATAAQMTAATGRISTLEGYFTGGVANSAKRLSGTASYTAWGQTYWQNGVPKGSFDGNLTIGTDKHISFKDSNDVARQALDYEANELWLGWGTAKEVNSVTNVIGYGVNIAVPTNSDYENVISVTTDRKVGVGTDTPSQELHVVGNIMATGAVSALGLSAQGSNSGALSLLTDVNISGTPANGYVLTYNSTSGKWTPQATQATDLSAYATRQWVEQNWLVKNVLASQPAAPPAVNPGDPARSYKLVVTDVSLSSGTLQFSKGYIKDTFAKADIVDFAHTHSTQDIDGLSNYALSSEVSQLRSDIGSFVGSLSFSGDYMEVGMKDAREGYMGIISELLVPFATTTMGFKRLNKEAAGTWDANTMTVGGVQYVLLTNYRSISEWANMPSGMSWGGVLQITAGSSAGVLSGQLAWDSNHNVTTGVTRKLYWRSRNSNGWGTNGWHTIAFEDWVTTQLNTLGDNLQTYVTTQLAGYLPLSGGTMKGDIVLGNTNNTTNDDSAKIAFHTNDNYPNISPYIQAINEANYGRKRLSVFQKNVADWNTPQTEVLSVMPDGTLRLTQAISFKGTKATYNMISFIDNVGDIYGNGIAIGGGGATIIGGGESAGTMSAQVSGGNEVMYIGNDTFVSIFTNLQNGWDYRKEFYFGADGRFLLPQGGSSRQMILHPDGQVQFRAATGGWAFSLGTFNNAGSASLGQFGNYGEGDSLNYMYIGQSYSNTWMVVKPSGNVGIGTISPSCKLDVNGAAHLSGDNSNYGIILANNKALGFTDSSGVNVRAFYLNDQNYLSLGWNTTLKGYNTGIYGNTLVFGTGMSTNEAARITAAGNVGIGTNNPQHKLHVAGNVVATGAVSALGVSSQGTAVGAVVADTLQVAGTSTLNGATTVNNTLDVSGDVTTENDVTVGGNLNLGEEGYIYAVGDELFWYAFSTGMTKKIAFV